MKKLETALTVMGLLLLASPAFAVDTTKVYNSGILVLVFVGICALFVVSQMIPAIIMLAGTIKSLFKNRKVVAAEAMEKNSN